MKNAEKRSVAEMLFRILLGILFALVIVIIIGTVYGLAAKRRPEKNRATRAAASVADAAESIFSGLGTIRVSTADAAPETVIISVSFPYDKNDRPFAEELVSRIPEFKKITADFLGGFTVEELSSLDSAKISGELLSKYNSLLRLGKIREVYLTDFIRL